MARADRNAIDEVEGERKLRDREPCMRRKQMGCIGDGGPGVDSGVYISQLLRGFSDDLELENVLATGMFARPGWRRKWDITE